MDDVTLPGGITIPATDLEIRASRSGGPGGQHANTSATQVELRFDVDACDVLTRKMKKRLRKRLANRITNDGVFILRSSEHRSQHKNREAAIARFRALVGEAILPAKQRIPTKPSKASDRRRLRDKRHRGRIKELRQDPEIPS